MVYWLSVTAMTGPAGTAGGSLFGWKTSNTNWNDNAVFGHLDTTGALVGAWQELFDPEAASAPVSLDLAFALTTTSTLTNPPPSPTNKWLQLPNVQNGLDVKATIADVLADDFLCTAAGTITNIQIWTLWLGDTVDSNATFTLGIWSDVPSASIARTVGFAIRARCSGAPPLPPAATVLPSLPVATSLFYDPNASPPGGIIGTDTKVWLYDFNPPQPFCQQGSPNNPVVYWLSMTVQTANGNALAGWKTSITNWNDDAVHGHLTATATALGDWVDMHDPRTGSSIDLSFLINNGPPGPDCDTNQVPKFVQWPDTSSTGLDVEDTAPRYWGTTSCAKALGR